MNQRSIFTVMILVAAAAACGGDDTKTPVDGKKAIDAKSTVDAFFSTCGEPGDPGNADGVGKFCESLSDCSSTAPLCSNLGDATTFFCTKTCTATGSGSDCGSDATCECGSGNDSGQCGCTPNTCLN